MELIGRSVVVRDYEEPDVGALYSILSDEKVFRAAWGPLTLAETTEFVRDALVAARADPRTSYELAVTLRDTGELVGRLGLKPDGYIPHLRRRTYELGYMLASDYWGRGLTTEAARLLLDFAFTELKLHRVFAVTVEENTPSIRVLEKLGFRREARHVDDVFEDGAWHTSLIYALLDREWPIAPAAPRPTYARSDECRPRPDHLGRTGGGMSDQRPLPVLLSHVLGAMTAAIEDKEAGAFATWCNVLRLIDDGIDERELPAAARISSRLATAWVTKAAREGLITAEPMKGTKNRRIQLTEAGAAAAKAIAARVGALDAQWRGSPLRDALERLVTQLRFELPHFPASYGTADPSAIGGPYMQNQKRKDDLPAHGADWKPVIRADGDTVSNLPVTALLSQALTAFTIDYEDRFPWPLASTATVLRHVTSKPRPLADLPEGHGITGKGKSLLERHLIVSVSPDPTDKRKKLVALTDRGELVLKHHPQRLEAVEKEWSDRYSEALVAQLRGALIEAAENTEGTYPDHVTAPLY